MHEKVASQIGQSEAAIFQVHSAILEDAPLTEKIRRTIVEQGLSASAALRSVLDEYESIFAMGPMLDNRDLPSIIEGNALCDRLGMDTVSMGSTLSFVAECLEEGVVTEEELGVKVPFGDGPAMVALIEATARREGVGALLAEGSTRLAQRFGPDAVAYLNAVKGLELAGHSARGVRPLSLGYATSTRGGSHHDSRPNYPPDGSDPGASGIVPL